VTHGAPHFQRARSPEQRETRRRAILDAAAAMVTEMPVADISLRELSRRVGLAKSNVLRYFESREEVFLELLDSGWTEWLAALARELQALPALPAGLGADSVQTKQRVDAIAVAMARSLADRPLLCELASVTANVLERNVSMPVARRFKIAAMNSMAVLQKLLRHHLPGLDEASAEQFTAATSVMVAGLWPLANPPSTVVAAYEDPTLAAARVGFEDGLRAFLTAQLTGVLHGGARSAPRPSY
jgi:AcrR family transcriptional regulator